MKALLFVSACSGSVEVEIIFGMHDFNGTTGSAVSPHVPVPIRYELMRDLNLLQEKLLRSVELCSVTLLFRWLKWISDGKLNCMSESWDENFLVSLLVSRKTLKLRLDDFFKTAEIFLYWKSWLAAIFHRHRCRSEISSCMHRHELAELFSLSSKNILRKDE